MLSVPVRRIDPAIAVASILCLVAVIFRLFTLRGLPNDHFMHLVWAQQLLFGELPGRDFVDPGMPLTYTLSAAVQYLSPGPFSEAVVTVVLLGIATLAITLVGIRLSGSLLIGAYAGLFAIFIRPRLYSYPKLLVPAVALLLLYWYEKAPSTRRLGVVAAWVAAGTLFRHDLGLIATLAVTAWLAARHVSDWRRLFRVLATFGIAVAIALLPYAIYVAATEGLAEHFRVSLEFAKIDAHQIRLTLPGFGWTQAGTIGAWTTIDSAVLLSHASRAFVVGGLLMLAFRWRNRTHRSTEVALLAILALYSVTVLRHPIAARISDLAAPLALTMAWAAGCLVRGAGSRLLVGAPVALAVVTLIAGSTLLAADVGRVGDRLIDANVHRGPIKVYQGLRELRAESMAWPWSRFWPQGDLPEVTAYVERCTAPTDRLLVTWFGPEFYYFTRRPFGDGLGLLYPGRAFTSVGDQIRMIERMRRHRVPIVLTNDERAPISELPLLAAYLAEEYREIGSFTMYDDTHVIIAVKRGLRATTTYGPDNWPCAFEPARPSRDA
jgi:hypothetical protein